jgi:hypothetical protein
MNNYDISSTGDNVELHCFYDTSLAQSFYDDFERENTRLSIGRDSSLFLIGEVEGPYYSKSDLLAYSKQALYELCQQYELIDYSVALNDYNKDDYIDDLLKITIKRHYEWLVNEHSWNGLSENIQHDFYISRGYSQGDAVYIVSMNRPVTKELRQHVDNVLWNSPIYINASINGDDYYTDDFIGYDDAYEWNRESIIEKIKTFSISEYAKQWLVNNLPEYPSYN